MVLRHSRLSSLPSSPAVDRSRLQVVPMVGGAVSPSAVCPPCPEVEVKKRRSPYRLEVTLVAPDQAVIDLWKNDKWVETVGEIDPADLDDGTDVDYLGRIKPDVIWKTLENMQEMLSETRDIDVRLPKKTVIFGAKY